MTRDEIKALSQREKVELMAKLEKTGNPQDKELYNLVDDLFEKQRLTDRFYSEIE